MPFTATEGTTQPIVLSKEPVEKPAHIVRGPMSIFTRQILSKDDRFGVVSFEARYGGFVVTYHDISVRTRVGECLSVYVPPTAMVTWEREPG